MDFKVGDYVTLKKEIFYSVITSIGTNSYTLKRKEPNGEITIREEEKKNLKFVHRTK